MWRMQSGNRILTDSEWSLFSSGLDLLRFWIEDDIENQTDETESGVPVFDRLTPEQKLGLLADVALALRDPEIPIPRHTAANEATIMAVFNTAKEQLAYELESVEIAPEKPFTHIRQALLAACSDSTNLLPDVNDLESDEWDWLFDEVVERVLWDYDFADGDLFLDLPPEKARGILKSMGIDPEYYLAIPEDPTEPSLIKARQTLARLLNLPMPDNEGLYPAIEDYYHGLIVGPFPLEVQSQWENHPWLETCQLLTPAWECDYEIWLEKLVGSIPTTPFALNPHASVNHDALPPNVVIDKWDEDFWVVTQKDGSYWCGWLDNCWTDEPDEEYTPALKFPSKEEAIHAYIQADQMYEERAKRHEEAMKILGWEVEDTEFF